MPHAMSPTEKNESFFRGLCVRLSVFTHLNPPIKQCLSEKSKPRATPDVSKWQLSAATCLSRLQTFAPSTVAEDETGGTCSTCGEDVKG